MAELGFKRQIEVAQSAVDKRLMRVTRFRETVKAAVEDLVVKMTLGNFDMMPLKDRAIEADRAERLALDALTLAKELRAFEADSRILQVWKDADEGLREEEDDAQQVD